MQTQSDQPPTSRSKAVRLDSFGGPEVLNVCEVPTPQAGFGEIRVRVTAAGLNPMDWIMTADADTAARFGLSLPSGFGTDYAGVVDQVGDGVTGFAPGDRVFGGAVSRAIADFVVVDPDGGLVAGEAHHTPDGVDDQTAATLAIAGVHGCRRPRRSRSRPGRHGADRRCGGWGRGVRSPASPACGRTGDRDGIGNVIRLPARPRGRAGRLWRRSD